MTPPSSFGRRTGRTPAPQGRLPYALRGTRVPKLWVSAMRFTDPRALAAAVDGVLGYAASDLACIEAQMREALDGKWPRVADPVEVCLDAIVCELFTLGYELRRHGDGYLLLHGEGQP